MTEAYTFIYCRMHDDGCIIKGSHEYVPDDYVMQHSTKCESCDWTNMGIIQFNGYAFDVIESVRVDYDRYGGEFLFIGYMNTLTDEKGNVRKNDVLDTWIKDIANKIQTIFIEKTRLEF
jgi:NDP-sugar pyrophosphorylase family protein